MKHFNRLLFLLTTVAAFSCTANNDIEPICSNSEYTFSFHATADADKTRTHIESENDVYGEIWWDEGDTLSLFTASEASNGGLPFVAKTTGFESDIEYKSADSTKIASEYFGVYPYDQASQFDPSTSTISTCIPSEQTSKYCSFDPKAAVTAGRSTSCTIADSTLTGKISFYNLCGGFRFSVMNYGITKVEFSSNAGEPIAGEILVKFGQSQAAPSVSVNPTGTKSSTITLYTPIDVTLSPNAYYYICMMPVVLTQGFTVKFYASDTQIAVCEYKQQIEVSRSSFWTIDNADNPALFGKNIAENGSANCYVISEAGAYKFPVVKGNSDEAISSAATAEVLWETVNTASAPSAGSLIKSVSTDGSYVYFNTADALTDGNALIAVKDASGNILWNWHIWLCSGYDPAATAKTPKGKSKKFMDRNLGALDAGPSGQSCYGLLYQWGRKDPFMGLVKSGSTVSLMASTGTESRIAADSSTGTLSYTLQNPLSFVYNPEGAGDWLFDARNNVLWTASKTIYDPCPAGWKVPDGEYEGIWAVGSENVGISDENLGGYLYSEDGGRIFFPTSGYRSEKNGEPSGAGTVGYYWTTTTNSQFANVAYLTFVFSTHKFNTYSSGWARGLGHSVRCVEE